MRSGQQNAYAINFPYLVRADVDYIDLWWAADPGTPVSGPTLYSLRGLADACCHWCQVNYTLSVQSHEPGAVAARLSPSTAAVGQLSTHESRQSSVGA